MLRKINLSKRYFSYDDSWSSNSETFLNEGVEKASTLVNDQWDAIERTLYEEEGDHVKDPKLLKECHLWKETFPHLRVRGVKIDLDGEKKVEEKITVKKVHPLSQNNRIKTCDKTETIKNRVVEEIVQRIITRFKNQNKLKSNQKPNDSVHCNGKRSDFQISKDSDDLSVSKSVSAKMPPNISQTKHLGENFIIEKNESKEILMLSSERESYFERGKVMKPDEKKDNNAFIQNCEKRISEIFDFWEEDELENKSRTLQLNDKKANKTAENLDLNLKPKLFIEDNFNLKNSMKQVERFHKSSDNRDSLRSSVKAFEPTKKIDKKYEALLSKILERNCGVPDVRIQHCQNQRNTARRNNPESHTYLESMEKIRVKSGFDDLFKKNNRNKETLPKINGMNIYNNCLEKSEVRNSFSKNDVQYLEKLKYFSRAVNSGRMAPLNYFSDLSEEEEENEKFMKQSNEKQKLKKALLPKDKALKEINLKRLKPLLTSYPVKEMSKSSICGSVPDKNKKIQQCGVYYKSKMENSKRDINHKNRTKFSSFPTNKQDKRTEKSSASLPPIETGIICKELVGHPKIVSKTSSKRQ